VYGSLARIALVHDVAGVATVQAGLLRNAGHEVDQIELPSVGARWRWPAKALTLPFRFAAYWPTVNRLRNGKYDVVHIHWLSHGVVGVMARRAFFVQAHGSDLHTNMRNPLYRRVTSWVLKRARKVFYVTPNLKAFLTDYDDKAVYLPNPVDMRGVALSFAPPTEVTKVVIFTRLDPVKGIEQIFPAAERLSKAVEVTALDWGPLARDYVRKYRQSVRFVKTVPHSTIGAFLGQFDLVIGQMRQGILSLMEIEALAAGRPVITAVNWDLYPDDPPPVLRAGSAGDILAAVTSLKSDPAELSRLSREGREWAVRNHSYAHHLELLQAAYFAP
jgi:glycosyltransferase involved in cell wall biosynthesis